MSNPEQGHTFLEHPSVVINNASSRKVRANDNKSQRMTNSKLHNHDWVFTKTPTYPRWTDPACARDTERHNAEGRRLLLTMNTPASKAQAIAANDMYGSNALIGDIPFAADSEAD